MKFFIIGIFIVGSTIAVACPNLSGTYNENGDDGTLTLKVEQTGCEHIALTFSFVSNGQQSPSMTLSYETDGKEHNETNYNMHLEPDESMKYACEYLGERFQRTDMYNHKSTGYSSWAIDTLFLDSKGNLIGDQTKGDSNGYSGSTHDVFVRVKK